MDSEGLFGCYYKGKYYLSYNCINSNYRGLGGDIVKELKMAINESRLGEWKSLLDKIKEVEINVAPTPNQHMELVNKFSLSASSSGNLWCQLLYKCQGSIENVLKSGYIYNRIDKNGQPIWEQFVYIVNLDENSFEYYHRGTKLRKFPYDRLPDWN